MCEFYNNKYIKKGALTWNFYQLDNQMISPTLH